MRVLFDGADLTGPRTGVFWSTYNLVLHLAREMAGEPGGGSLQVLHYRRPCEVEPLPAEFSDLLDLLALEPVSFRFLPSPSRGKAGLPLAGLHYLINTLAWPAVKGLGRLPARLPDELDIYHCSDGLLVKGGRAIKLVTVHDLVSFIFPHFQTLDNRLYHKRKLSYVRHRANHVIAVSENTKRDLLELFKLAPERVSVIYNGCDPIFKPCPAGIEMDAVRKRLQIQGPYLLCVSTLEPRKNLKRLIDCFTQLKQRPAYQDLSLVLVGAKGWKSEELVAKIDGLKGTGLIHLQQVSRQFLPYLYSGAEIFLYPSIYEGFGLPVLEAMACGCPVVAGRSSSIPEVLGEAGLMFHPESVEEMVEKVHLVLEDTVFKEKVVRRGLERAQQFSWKRTARQVVGLYRQLLGQ